MQAWQEEVERARQGQRDAERKLSSMEASFSGIFLGHNKKYVFPSIVQLMANKWIINSAFG